MDIIWTSRMHPSENYYPTFWSRTSHPFTHPKIVSETQVDPAASRRSKLSSFSTPGNRATGHLSLQSTGETEWTTNRRTGGRNCGTMLFVIEGQEMWKKSEISKWDFLIHLLPFSEAINKYSHHSPTFLLYLKHINLLIRRKHFIPDYSIIFSVITNRLNLGE